MKSEPKGWDRDLKLGNGFFLILVLVGPLELFLIWPWLLEQPSIDLMIGNLKIPMTVVAGGLVYPFCTSALIYAFWKIFDLIFFKKEITRTQVW